MGIKLEQKLKDVDVFTSNSEATVQVRPLQEGATLQIRLVDWSEVEASKIVIYGTNEFMEDLEHALSVYNQERRVGGDPEAYVHSVYKNGVKIPA